MKTVASVVEKHLKTKPFLLSSLSEGIINLTSLARIIMPEIELYLGKDIKQGAVVMALKRISEELDFKINHKVTRVLQNIGEITVRSSLTDYTYEISDTLLENQTKLISEIKMNKNLFYTSSRGVNEANIVVSSEINAMVESYLKSEKLISKNENLSSITVKLPHENVSVPGVYYYIFQSLAWEGIVIDEVISTSNEFTIVVNEIQIDLAFSVIKDLKKIG
ncbi:aspartate kinase [Flavobacterium sp.]|uniref:aspartate kinase n=1 Tax=Flavobacterium sp. TaxID=239 RepID=UPI003340E4F3